MHQVNKPWGEEFRVEVNSSVALTYLVVGPSQATSLHCHPIKTTSLLCLEGSGTIEFFNSNYELEPGKGFTIRNGLFHRIINKLGSEPFRLLEFENPIDKNDLVRFSDNYGREESPYEEYSNNPSSEELLLKIVNLVKLGGVVAGKDWEAEMYFSLSSIVFQEGNTYVVISGNMFDVKTAKLVLRQADCISDKTLQKLMGRFKPSNDLTLLCLRPSVEGCK